MASIIVSFIKINKFKADQTFDKIFTAYLSVGKLDIYYWMHCWIYYWICENLKKGLVKKMNSIHNKYLVRWVVEWIVRALG